MMRTLAVLLTSLIGGFWLVQTIGQAWSDYLQVRTWLAVAMVPLVSLQVATTARYDKGNRAHQRDIEAATPGNLMRIGLKSLALGLSWSVILLWALLCSWINSDAAIIFVDDFLPIFPYLVVAVPAGVMLLERLDGARQDQWYHLGAAILGKTGTRLRDHKPALLTAALKAFFVPLMYGNAILAMSALLSLGPLPTQQTWVAWFFSLGLSMDLVVATIGYVFASRALGTGVRSVDDSVLGWLVCLICYAPLSQYVKLLTRQTDTFIWSDWLSPTQAPYWIWALLIVTTWLVYWLSTTAFGMRFSNLSYRGLVDIGPYRFFKHPAYLSKCTYWWLVTVPFYGVLNTFDMIRNFTALGLVSFIYYLRARTEERHLSRFPEYVQYSKRIDDFWARIWRRTTLPIRRITQSTQ